MSHERESGAADTGSPQKETRPRKTMGVKSAYFWGAASGVAVALFAPMLRPAARTAVKEGIRVGRYAKKLASNVKEEFEDIASEAQADLDRDNTEKDKDKGKKG